MSTSVGRVRREEAADRAHSIQIVEGSKAAAKWGALGLGVVTMAHYTWPAFRRQTFPFKTFLVTLVTTCGLIIGADHALLSFEADVRESEYAVRRRAQMDLARQGIPPTESAINRWREEKAKQESAGEP